MEKHKTIEAQKAELYKYKLDEKTGRLIKDKKIKEKNVTDQYLKSIFR